MQLQNLLGTVFYDLQGFRPRSVCSPQMCASVTSQLRLFRHTSSHFPAQPLPLRHHFHVYAPELFLRLISSPPLPSQVHFVSDFFKKRPPRSIKPDAADSEEPERKPSLQIADSEHGNHYNYHHGPGPV